MYTQFSNPISTNLQSVVVNNLMSKSNVTHVSHIWQFLICSVRMFCSVTIALTVDLNHVVYACFVFKSLEWNNLARPFSAVAKLLTCSFLLNFNAPLYCDNSTTKK